MRSQTPDLSIVIPVLNEAETLNRLFATLECQCGLCLEIIFSVAQCCDDSEQLIAGYAGHSIHSVVVLPSSQGRARQMNRAADLASGDLLLFLHADSSWEDRYLLRDAVASFYAAGQVMQSAEIAGHFCLNFGNSGQGGLFYRYLSEKSSLNRRGTIYGDQGMMLTPELWRAAGRFREDVPSLEDVLFADAVNQRASWVLLPQCITTSSRRYQRDGVVGRVVMNALLIIVAGAGLFDASSRVAQLEYVVVTRGKHSVCRLLADIELSVRSLSMKQYCAFWYSCAKVIFGYSWFPWYACGWLLPALNVKHRTALLSCYECWLMPLLNNRLCFGAMAVSSWLLFYLACLFLVFSGSFSPVVRIGVESQHHN